jgi:hypothetical protein
MFSYIPCFCSLGIHRLLILSPLHQGSSDIFTPMISAIWPSVRPSDSFDDNPLPEAITAYYFFRPNISMMVVVFNLLFSPGDS